MKRTQRILVAVAVAVVVACALDVLCEWRMQGILFLGTPANVFGWNLRRLLVVGVGLLCVTLPLAIWVALGGVSRVRERIAHLGAAGAKRFGIAVLLVALTSIVGALAGWLMGGALGNADDWRYGVFLAVFLDLAVLATCFRREILREASWGFLLFGTCIGIVLIVLTPIQPVATWDGVSHFNVANAMSYVDSGEYDAGDLLSLRFAPLHVAGTDGGRVWADLSLDAVTDTVEQIDGAQAQEWRTYPGGTQRYHGGVWIAPNAVGRAPLAVGMWLARMLGSGNVGELIGGRVANLCVYLVLWFLGIRYLRSSKEVFCAIALAPMGLHLATNFNYDPLLLGCFGLATCRFFGEWQRRDEPLTLGRGLAIVAPFVLGSLVKAVYFPMGLVFLALPREKFRGRHGLRRWQWLAMVCAGAFVLFASFGLPFLAKGGQGYSDTRLASGVDSGSQMGYILGHPIEYVMVILRGVLDLFTFSNLCSAVAMPGFLYCAQEEPLAATYLVFLLLVALLVRQRVPNNRLPWYVRVLGLIGCLAALGVFATSLYVGATDVGADHIVGLQQRYAFALFPILVGMELLVPWLLRLGERGFERACTAQWAFLWVYHLMFVALYFVAFFG